VVVALCLTFAAACDQKDSPTALQVAAVDAELDGSGYGVFGSTTLKRDHSHAFCAGERYRDFDFWLGDWNVVGPTGAPTGGTNRIVRDLDGCAVLENWTAANGSRGRSLNAYDRGDGQWHQMWVAPNGFSPLRIAGVKEDGVLEMSGVRVSPFGFSVVDTIRWQAISADIVNQAGTKDIPGFSHSAFSINYHRTANLQPAPELVAADCQPGGSAAENRLADFLVGSWKISSEHGLPIANSSVELDLSGCLFVERINGPLGFESITFFHYDAVTDKWTRGTMDNLGNWLEMTGPVDHGGGPIVLTGTKAGPGASASLVRLTIESVSAGRIRQTLQTSHNDGLTWSPGVTLIYER
jgi:hypothetical protein